MHHRPYIATRPNVPVECLIAKPSTFVVQNLIEKVGEPAYFEQGFALTGKILLPEAEDKIDLSQPALTRIVQTLTSVDGIVKVDGTEHNIGEARLRALKEQLISNLRSSLLCEACPLRAREECKTKFIVDQDQESLGVFPSPTEGVQVATLTKPNTPFLPRNSMPLAG